MDSNSAKGGHRHHSSSGSRSSHTQSSSHSGSHSGSHHRSREEHPLGSENSYSSSGRLTNMSHVTSAPSDRHKHSTGPPGSGPRQYEWVESQQGKSREDYSPSINSRIESLRSSHKSSSRSRDFFGDGSQSSRSGSVTAPNSPLSGSSYGGSHRSSTHNSTSQHGASRSHESGYGFHHSSSVSHRDSSGPPYSASYSESHHSDSYHASPPLAHGSSGLGPGSRAAHEPRALEKEHRNREGHSSRRNKHGEEIENNPNQGPVSPFITALSLAICHSMGKPEGKPRKK